MPPNKTILMLYMKLSFELNKKWFVSEPDGRKDQKFLYGEEIDCEHFMTAYEACMQWKMNKDEKQLVSMQLL